MIKLAANISTMFTEWPLLERPRQAAKCGFKAIELQFLSNLAEAEALAKAVSDAGLEVVLVNAPCGDRAAGELGLAGLTGQGARFSEAVAEGLAMADVLGAPRMHVMAGRRQADVSEDEQWAQLTRNFALAAEAAAEANVLALTEPLNARLAPDYLVRNLETANTLVAAVDHPSLAIQFDLYHLQIMGGDILTRFAASLDRVGHVQLAAVPHRDEPDRGELDIHRVLEGVSEAGYAGWIGCEYLPHAGTLEGLGWAQRYGVAAP